MTMVKLTDAELRAFLTVNPGNILARDEAVARFCDTVSLRDMHNSVTQALGIVELVKSYSNDVRTLLEEVEDALNRTTK